MRKVFLINFFISLLLFSQAYAQVDIFEEARYSSEIEFQPCNDSGDFSRLKSLSCIEKRDFLHAVYTAQASFGVVNAICLLAPEPLITKAIVVLNAGLGVASVILRRLPCEEEGELNGVQRREVLEEVCRLTGGEYDPIFDKCNKQ